MPVKKIEQLNHTFEKRYNAIKAKFPFLLEKDQCVGIVTLEGDHFPAP